MILNVSGRTDVVAFYSKWFLKRLEVGYFDVKNPFNPKLISRIYFEDVDAILFCTKNPLPLLEILPKLSKPVLVHVTLTPYNKDIEPNVPNKKDIIEAIKNISKIIGKENIWVRYDPIFLSEKYNLVYHKKAFKKMCCLLNGYVTKIIISFIDEYKNVKKNKQQILYRKFTLDDYKEIGLTFARIALDNNMSVQTCAEGHNLVEYGFKSGECLSKELAKKLTGKSYKIWKERTCNCVSMVDVGQYNSCPHMCKYCYANYNEKDVFDNYCQHNPNSSLLIGEIEDGDIIKIRHF